MDRAARVEEIKNLTEFQVDFRSNIWTFPSEERFNYSFLTSGKNTGVSFLLNCSFVMLFIDIFIMPLEPSRNEKTGNFWLQRAGKEEIMIQESVPIQLFGLSDVPHIRSA